MASAASRLLSHPQPLLAAEFTASLVLTNDRWKSRRRLSTLPAVRAIPQESRRCRSAGFLCRQFVDRGAYGAIEERHGLDDQSRGAFAQLPRKLFRRDGDRLATGARREDVLGAQRAHPRKSGIDALAFSIEG